MRVCFDRSINRATPKGVFQAWGLKEGWLDQHEEITFFHGKGVTKEHIKEWLIVFKELESFTNLTFKEGDDWDDSIMRISYQASSGSWSYVGNDNYHVKYPSATTNIGWLDLGTKRHELGHFIGLGHEHQTPENPIQWDKEYVYNKMSGAPNFWSREQTDYNFFRIYDKDIAVGTSRDPDSVMMYPIPKEFTLDGFSTTNNDNWSEKDIAFLSGIYPKDEEVTEGASFLIIKSFIGTYMKNDPKQVRKLKAAELKEIAMIVGVKYRNKRDAAKAIIDKLKE